VAPGTATLSATVEGKTGVAVLSVSLPPVSAVVVSPSSLSMDIGATTELSAVLLDSQGNVLANRNITWRVSDQQLASVTVSGQVTALKSGTVIVTAESEGIVDTALIAVVERSVVGTGFKNGANAVNGGLWSAGVMGYNGNAVWQSPENVLANDGSRASANLDRPGNAMSRDADFSTWLHVTNFGFIVPEGATIVGATVEIVGYGNRPGAGVYTTRILQDGTRTEELGAGSLGFASDAAATIGTSSNLIGKGYTRDQVSNNSTFGVGFVVKNYNMDSQTAFVNSVRMNIFYLPAPEVRIIAR
jgi:hypothetical protein